MEVEEKNKIDEEYVVKRLLEMEKSFDANATNVLNIKNLSSYRTYFGGLMKEMSQLKELIPVVCSKLFKDSSIYYLSVFYQYNAIMFNIMGIQRALTYAKYHENSAEIYNSLAIDFNKLEAFMRGRHIVAPNFFKSLKKIVEEYARVYSSSVQQNDSSTKDNNDEAAKLRRDQRLNDFDDRIDRLDSKPLEEQRLDRINSDRLREQNFDRFGIAPLGGGRRGRL